MKGFVYLLEIAVVAILVTVVLGIFFSVRIKQNWEKSDLISTGYNMLNYIKQDNNSLIDILNENLTEINALRTKNMNYNLQVIGAPKSNIEVGCGPSTSCPFIRNYLLTPAYVNKRWINFTVKDLDLDAPEFPDYDAIVFLGLDNYTKQKNKINNYLNRGGAVIGINGTYGKGDAGFWEIFNISDPPETLTPNAPGAYTQLNYQNPSGGEHWDKVTDSDDNTLVGLMNTNSYTTDTYNISDTSIPVGSKINNVTVYVRVYGEPTFIMFMQGYFKITINTYNKLYNGTETLLPFLSWTTYSNTWTKNPSTGANWTVAEINALEIGISLKNAYDEINFEYSTDDCARVYAVIDYTSPPPNSFREYNPSKETIPKYFLGIGFDVLNTWTIWEESWRIDYGANYVNITKISDPSNNRTFLYEGKNFSLKGPDSNDYQFKIKKIWSDRTDIQPLNKSFVFKDFAVAEGNVNTTFVENIIIKRSNNFAAMTSNNTAIWISDFPLSFGTVSDEYKTLVKAAILSRTDKWIAKGVSTDKERITVSSFIPLCCDMPETAELYLTLWYEL